MTVGIVFGSTFGTYCVRQIKSRSDTSVGNKFGVFTIRTNVVRGQGINLWDTCHRSNKGRSNRSTRSNKISLTFTVPNQLLGNHIKNRKSVLYNRVKLFWQTLFNQFGKRVAVNAFGAGPTDILQIIFRPFHFRGKWAVGNRNHIVINKIGYVVSVSYNNLVRLFLA